MNSATSSFFIALNPLVIPLLQSRFHWLMSPALMLVKFVGRKSGRQFITPSKFLFIIIEFVQFNKVARLS